jgi:anaerobic magnesium-protoporphyrin IX monomethyl ester cyclase
VRIKLVSLEDGITSCGFRKMAAYVSNLNADTEALYVSTSRYRTVRRAIKGNLGAAGVLTDDEVDQIADGLADSDMVGFSSMSGYADLTRRISTRLRAVAPDTYQVWGGIHPIIHPEDAILAPVDAICVGEGEHAFQEFYELMQSGEDVTGVKNFWFKRGDEVVRNHFLPLMTVPMMEELPFPAYGQDNERIFRSGEGFMPMGRQDYLMNDGISYTTLWSIGCPFHCTYCGNTKFIANDPLYKRIRHTSARYIVDEVKDVRSRFPHLTQVSFHDDSFMAISYGDLEEFAELWKSELDIPFAVYGVIPNYVKREKLELLTWAGMNRVRMGVQSGSRRILEFYRRPSPPEKIFAAADVISSLAPRHHIPPAYDVIVDNPVETRDDVVESLQLFYDLPRPYTLFIYSLRVIPNTQLAKEMEERGFDLDDIDQNYFAVPPRMGNLLMYLLPVVRPPRWLWDRLLRRVEASTTPQKEYPRTLTFLRGIYLAKRGSDHVRHMDFSVWPGRTGYVLWRLGITGFWQRRIWKRLPRPERARDGTGAAASPAAEVRVVQQG